MFEAIFQCANCLFLDAYFGSKVEFIWSEKIIVKVKILKKRFHHSVAFSGQALMIYHNLKFSLKQIQSLYHFTVEVLVLKTIKNANNK